MINLSRDEYIKEIQYCYENSRWEFSFYTILYLYLCQFRNADIKLVHCANWRSRGVKTSKDMKENLKTCSIKLNDKYGKEYIGGIPDFQFVSSKYSYGKSCKANVFIEFKAPIFSNEGVYQPLIYNKTTEIEHEFKNCDKIIFTDGLSWYFLEKHQTNSLEKPINLINNDDNWNILKTKITKFIEPNTSK